MINVFQPSAGGAELAAIEQVLRSNWLGTGDRVGEFERAFADYIGRPAGEVLAVSSCTEGLFQVVSALGVGPGDDVVLPTISFVGAAHAVRSAGARVVLCDVNPGTLNPTAGHIEAALTPATKAVLLLHYGGDPGAVSEIAGLAREHSLLLVEDAAVGLGSFVGERACGTLGDVGVWSFDSMKVLTTGDGGMVWSRAPSTATRIRAGVRLGVASSGFHRRRAFGRWWEVEPRAVGRRGTMNDVAAAMGMVQLEQLPAFLQRRNEIAATYDDALGGLPWLRPPRQLDSRSARTFYWLQTDAVVRDRLAAYLLERDVYATFRYWPLHRMRMYCQSGDAFPGGNAAAASTLLLPLHQGLSDGELECVVAAVRAFSPEGY